MKQEGSGKNGKDRRRKGKGKGRVTEGWDRKGMKERKRKGEEETDTMEDSGLIRYTTKMMFITIERNQCDCSIVRQHARAHIPGSRKNPTGSGEVVCFCTVRGLKERLPLKLCILSCFV